VPSAAGGVARGKVTFVNNTVDPTTGTIQIKATFSNDDNALWPGQFVNVALILARQPGALVVPAQAVQSGQKGQFVFVVKADQTVEARPVVTGASDGSDVVIASGVRAGERVVTDGQLRLLPGTRVEVKPATPAPAPAATKTGG
jgi:multidrug efflux system membrane fusion protein